MRKLSAIEGLGSCTLIASDKTGTMTQNRLSVENFITLKQVYGAKENIEQNILLGSILCNESSSNIENDEFCFIGDQVDIALARYALHIDNSLYKLQKEIKPINNIPYEPVNKFSAMSYKLDNQKIHFIKGSPEIIINK